ncbi:alkaline phosphatase [Luteimonas sp. SJ-92]|uniref:Alkaline phosphatase n=1 Tax=Luteimonas salinisoli TaxID=2752307 RepID=A0A853J803_9GAMM|nr:alkaline phosphatase [Luteimonas salinisoli]NZA24874.1 alkaline phosphatase [Luteimonas salinisoli]
MRPFPRCLLPLLLCACATAPAAPDAPAAGGTPAPIELPAISRPDGETAQWWFRSGAAAAAERGAMHGRARNVILFVGDGMSLTTVAAARILAGQLAGGAGEEHRLGWEDFPHTALARTYNTDLQTPDSAGTMTAMASGVKTRAGVIGLGQARSRGDCSDVDENSLLSILELAGSAGMATGIVTTTRITHATPAATYARSPDRIWENDARVPPAARALGCTDIASQLLETRFGRGPDVVFGGGRKHFLPAGRADPERPERRGLRRDGRDLIAEWRARHPGGAFVWNRDQLAAARARTPVLGLFEYDHLHFEHDRPHDPGEPSLAELTREAVGRLQAAGGEEGFVLLVEGGRIDHAHHFGNAHRALTDTIALAEAVDTAAELTSPDDTLILVTADHAHTLTFAGYPARGNPILGKVRGNVDDADSDAWARDGSGLPYTTLGYANGPGYTGASDTQPAGPKRFLHEATAFEPAHGRPHLGAVDTRDPDYLQESVLPLTDETHGGDDVGIWARGPGAAAVRGSVEQHVVFHFMVQAAPRLRERLCAAGLCNADGVPVELPRPRDFMVER